MAYLQSNIPHFKCWVRKEYTHNHQQYHGEYIHALAIAVTCIPDRCLSFQVVFTGAETYEDVLGKTMGRLIISDYGLKPEYLATKQNFRTNKNEIGLIFHDIVDKASKELNVEQRKLLYYLMNGDQVELSKLSPEALAINAEVRTLIIKYGQELVDRGLLDEKIFRKNDIFVVYF